MPLDQTIQIVSTLGTWIAGIGALAAAAVALWLARRSEKVKLRCYVGLRLLVGAGISQECLSINVTNVGERAVTVSSVAWCVGTRKKKKFAIQALTSLSVDQFPRRIEYAESASFMVNFSEAPKWLERFAEDFISDNKIDTLRAQIYTSVGHTENVKPEDSLLEKLRELCIEKS